MDTYAQVESGRLAPTATLTKPARDLHVPAVVLALPLGLTAKLVFAEILDLYRVAGRVFARDAHFAERLGCGVRTIGSAIAELEAAGYLTRPIDHTARQKRVLVPVQKWLPNRQGVIAESATSSCNYGNEWLPNQQGVVAESADINTILNTSRNNTEKKESSAAVAATRLPGSEKKSTSKHAKKSGATHEEIAALPLPHVGAEFADTWRTFYTGNTKQADKPIASFRQMLKKLSKYPSVFAVEALEAAIQGNWSSPCYNGIAEVFNKWQAGRPHQPSLSSSSPPADTAPPSNRVFTDQLNARQKAEDEARRQQFRAANTQSTSG